jgi:hypothetical protein
VIKVVFNIYHVIAQVVNCLEEPAAFSFYPEDGGRRLAPIVGKYLQDYYKMSLLRTYILE